MRTSTESKNAAGLVSLETVAKVRVARRGGERGTPKADAVSNNEENIDGLMLDTYEYSYNCLSLTSESGQLYSCCTVVQTVQVYRCTNCTVVHCSFERGALAHRFYQLSLILFLTAKATMLASPIGISQSYSLFMSSSSNNVLTIGASKGVGGQGGQSRT